MELVKARHCPEARLGLKEERFRLRQGTKGHRGRGPVGVEPRYQEIGGGWAKRIALAQERATRTARALHDKERCV
eukprot:1585469-Pyramimonas_sp.AAC.1